MSGLVNFILIVLILIIIAFACYKYINSVSMESDDEFLQDDDSDISTLRKKIAREFTSRLNQNIGEKNMTKKEYKTKQKQKAILRKNLSAAASGDVKAKKFIKNMIKYMLIDPDMNMGVNEVTIDEIIPFEKEKELKSQDKFEIVLYIASHHMTEAETGRALGKNGFQQIIKQFDVLKPVMTPQSNGEYVYDFTEEKLNEVYESLRSEYELSYNDKLEILTQRIFEGYKGFGVVDALFETGIDEIDGGVSGVPKDGFDIMNSAKNLTYTYQAIWVIISGIKLRLSCISFGSQEELMRVVQNIYKYGANRVLSKKNGYVISVMKNGSRVIVMRPPFANTYAFLARKFDSTPSVEPEKIIQGFNAIIPITLIKWLIKGQRNVAITGAQGTGKSTLLKSLVRFIHPKYSLRVQEKTAELNLNYAYPYRNILSFQETESIDSQEGLNLQKKTSGDVNVVGEVAEAIQANFVVQTAMVASLFAMFSHHAKTLNDLIMSFANNLLDPNCGIYRDKKEAIEVVAKILNIDVHLENKNGKRYIERISECIPINEMKYPSEIGNASHEQDELEYWKRETDRKPYEERILMHYENGEFVLDNLPSKQMIDDIRSKLSPEEEKQFLNEMKMIRDLPRMPKDAKVMIDEDPLRLKKFFDEDEFNRMNGIEMA